MITTFLSFGTLFMILVRGYDKVTSIGPKHFGLSKLFWTGANCFDWGQIILFRFKLDFSILIVIIWTCPKLFGPNQN